MRIDFFEELNFLVIGASQLSNISYYYSCMDFSNSFFQYIYTGFTFWVMNYYIHREFLLLSLLFLVR